MDKGRPGVVCYTVSTVEVQDVQIIWSTVDIQGGVYSWGSIVGKVHGGVRLRGLIGGSGRHVSMGKNAGDMVRFVCHRLQFYNFLMTNKAETVTSSWYELQLSCCSPRVGDKQSSSLQGHCQGILPGILPGTCQTLP